MSTADKLSAIIANNEAIIESRDAIAISIANKGVVVPLGTKLDGMAALIDAIVIGSSDDDTSTPSGYYLHKRVLTPDDGYQIESIPISAGDVVALGGSDVAASTDWGDYYSENSHPEMTFDSWSSPTTIVINNEYIVPDDLYTDLYVAANYYTADGQNHYIQSDGSYATDNVTNIAQGSFYSDDANQYLAAAWLKYNAVIGSYAFNYCNDLVNINIVSAGSTIIGQEAFSSCEHIEAVVIGNGIQTIDDSAFRYCYMLESIIIPNTVTTIEGCAFASCEMLSHIVIPESVTSIGSWGFDGSGIDYMILNSSTPPTLANSSAIPAAATIYVPAESVTTYKSTTNWSAHADRIKSIEEFNQ